MKEQNLAFAERLRAAAKEAGCDGAKALMTRFNASYPGPSVTQQATSQWLQGRVIPRLDKIQVLAEVLRVDLHWLQTGAGTSRKLRQAPPAWPDALEAQDRQAVEALLALPEEQRRVVTELISMLAAVPKAPVRR